MPDDTSTSNHAGREVAEATLRRLLTEISEGRLEVYLNVLDQPYVVFRVEGYAQGCHYLMSDFVRAWITEYAWTNSIGLLRPREIDPILRVLLGRALRNNRPQIEDKAQLNVLRTVPVVAVVYEYMYMQQNPVLDTTMQSLYGALEEFAKERNLIKLGSKRFPGGSNWLSHELDQYRRILAKFGIDVSIRRSNGSKVTLTRRSDDPSTQSSAEPSGSNVPTDNPLRPTDAKTECLARLRAKKAGRQQNEEKERR